MVYSSETEVEGSFTLNDTMLQFWLIFFIFNFLFTFLPLTVYPDRVKDDMS